MLEVRPTTNLDDIKAVLSHPEIWRAITMDGMAPPDKFDFSLYETWLNVAGYVDGKPIAVLCFHPYLDGTKLHVHVLPEYRKQYSREFGAIALQWATYPLYAEIPDFNKNVQQYAQEFGFVPIEKFERKFTIDGKPYVATRYMRELICHLP